MPANFKTYESQARLLAATIAAHPELRLNYKERFTLLSLSPSHLSHLSGLPLTWLHYGQSHTASALEHRFRPVRTQAEFLRQVVTHGEDPENINILDMNKAEMAKYFGDSTPDGLQFQFRAIKASSEAMKAAVERGEDPVAAFNSNKSAGGSGSGTSTPGPSSARKRARPTAPKIKTSTTNTTTTTGARASTPTTATPGTSTSTKRRTKAVRPTTLEDTDRDESSAVDYDALDESPTKQIKKLKTTPTKTPLAIRMERTPSRSDAASGTVGTTTQDAMSNHHTPRAVQSIFGGGSGGNPISHNGTSNGSINVKKEANVHHGDEDDDGFVMFTHHPASTAMHAANSNSNNTNNNASNNSIDTSSTPFQMFAAMPSSGQRFDLTDGFDEFIDDFGHDTGDI
ncbi:hypothetical protein B0T19DRAFT_460833 [Cercophora scortea]|uniref:Uncharacterized protein n=1 Tax=Cercophora scortea TaxID=314031 RepID=A0AAE0IM65_9PEZI|nr:hypothetical protein B0T19DRAFT_460833 [Cercophora scortea]